LSRFFLLVFLFLSPALLSGQSESSSSDRVILKPKPIHDVLRNPGMGIQTFQRFAGQALNPERRWSERGPEAPLSDEAPGSVDFPVSSVAYVRWFWSQLEPKQGEYRWDIIESALAEARKHGQKLAIRVMPYDQKDPLPEWYIKSGARRANKPEDEDGKIWSPDSDDPFYIENWSKFVRGMGERFDGHPDLDTVDISTFGYWGEGWGPYPPSKETQVYLIDVHFAAFRKTKLLMNFDVQEMLYYGTSRGAGWRLDCWGDDGRPGRNFAHMVDMYPIYLASPEIRDVWKRSPVSLEVCGTVAAWKAWNFDLQPILDAALRWRASTINLKSSPIPSEWKAAFDDFQKKLGYRYSLRRFEHPRKVRKESPFQIKMLWLNAGVAPTYDAYNVVLEWRSGERRQTTTLPIDLRNWVTGDWVYEGPIVPPAGLVPGTYQLRLGILDPTTQQPTIVLANEGLEKDGWYQLTEIEVSR
jgi:hypothetical protein